MLRKVTGAKARSTAYLYSGVQQSYSTICVTPIVAYRNKSFLDPENPLGLSGTKAEGLVPTASMVLKSMMPTEGTYHCMSRLELTRTVPYYLAIYTPLYTLQLRRTK